MSAPGTTSLEALTGNYKLDPTHSRIGFVARHAMITKVRGAFNEYEGEGYLDGADPSKSSVSVTIKTDSIDTRNEQRDGHLRGNDFLDIPNYPEIRFVSTAARQTGDGEFEITGDLTIKDVTRQITIPFTFEGAVSDPWGNQRLGFEGSTTINRSDYGVTWNAALETGGVLVSDKIVLEFELSVVKVVES